MNILKARQLLKIFLDEDIQTGDLSTELVFEKDQKGEGVFIAKSDGIMAGEKVIYLTYEAYGENVEVNNLKHDKEILKKGDVIAEVKGNVYTLLSCERLILNIMQRMSGIATMTNKAIKLLDDETIRICDTRKTMPGLRFLDKYAVTCGGGFNHRFGLYDAVMLKDNHIQFAGGISNAIKLVKGKVGHTVKVEVEVEQREQVIEAVEAGADIIMFDNRTPEQIKEFVQLVPKHIVTEASGGINLNNISSFKGCGVNYISLGALTHSVMPVDISFYSKDGVKEC